MAEDDKKPELLIPWLTAGQSMHEEFEADAKRSELLRYYTDLNAYLIQEDRAPINHMAELIRFQKHWYALQSHDLNPTNLTFILQSCSAALELMPAQLKKTASAP